MSNYLLIIEYYVYKVYKVNKVEKNLFYPPSAGPLLLSKCFWSSGQHFQSTVWAPARELQSIWNQNECICNLLTCTEALQFEKLTAAVCVDHIRTWQTCIMQTFHFHTLMQIVTLQWTHKLDVFIESDMNTWSGPKKKRCLHNLIKIDLLNIIKCH